MSFSGDFIDTSLEVASGTVGEAVEFSGTVSSARFVNDKKYNKKIMPATHITKRRNFFTRKVWTALTHIHAYSATHLVLWKLAKVSIHCVKCSHGVYVTR